MTARPIIFSAPMIRALLAGEKTQTRRIVKPQPPADYENISVDMYAPTRIDRYGEEYPGDMTYGACVDDGSWCTPCPYGQPGDFLWVRETWFEEYDDNTARPFTPPRAIYRATEQNDVRFMDDDGFTAFNRDGTMKSPWRPSIHMPRWASRLTLRITDVRVQRLQEISEADARAEGCSARPFPGPWWQGYRELNGALVHEQAIGDQPPDWMIEPKRMADTPHLDLTAVDDFRSVWHSIHGPDSWSANPWVWALTFDVIHKNIDEVVDDD